MEYDVTEYLLKHKEGIKDLLKATANDAKNNPVLRSYFREAVTDEVVKYLTEGLSLNYEDVAQIVDDRYLLNLLGEEFFNL